jgi:hypothetical protein
MQSLKYNDATAEKPEITCDAGRLLTPHRKGRKEQMRLCLFRKKVDSGH